MTADRRPLVRADCGSRRPRTAARVRGPRRCTLVWGARGSRSSAILDLDDDGDLDIVTNDFNTSPMVLVSNLSDRTAVHYVSESSSLAPRRIATALAPSSRSLPRGSTYTKVMDGDSGYLSHSLCPLYFGLGSAQAVESIDVKWPSGKTQSVRPPIKVNSLIEIREE